MAVCRVIPLVQPKKGGGRLRTPFCDRTTASQCCQWRCALHVPTGLEPVMRGKYRTPSGRRCRFGPPFVVLLVLVVGAVSCGGCSE